MATKIRLKRIGRRNRPFYRLIVIDSRKQRDGMGIEEVGWYNPIDVNHSYDLKGDRILHWLGQGAIPTNAAYKLMRRAGIAYRWHLIQQGMDEADIDKEMKKWELNRDDVLKARISKIDKKKAKVDKQKASTETKADVTKKPKEDAETPTDEKRTELGLSVDEGEESSDEVTEDDKESKDKGIEPETFADDSPDPIAEESDSEDIADVVEDSLSEEE